jgi:hypothetical protein
LTACCDNKDSFLVPGEEIMTLVPYSVGETFTFNDLNSGNDLTFTVSSVTEDMYEISEPSIGVGFGCVGGDRFGTDTVVEFTDSSGCQLTISTNLTEALLMRINGCGLTYSGHENIERLSNTIINGVTYDVVFELSQAAFPDLSRPPVLYTAYFVPNIGLISFKTDVIDYVLVP